MTHFNFLDTNQELLSELSSEIGASPCSTPYRGGFFGLWVSSNEGA